MPSDLVELVGLAEGGDQRAWDQLVDRYADLVWHVVRGCGLSGAQADDVFQTTWLRATEHLGRIRDPERFGSWLATTAKNECYRATRLARREQPIAQHVERMEPRPGPEAQVLDAFRDAVLWQALSSLSAPCRALLRLLLAEPALSYAQIAEVLDIPVGSIGPTRARCLDRLRRARDVHHLET